MDQVNLGVVCMNVTILVQLAKNRELALFKTGMVLFENWTCLFAGPKIGLEKENYSVRQSVILLKILKGIQDVRQEGLGARQEQIMLKNILIPRVTCPP